MNHFIKFHIKALVLIIISIFIIVNCSSKKENNIRSIQTWIDRVCCFSNENLTIEELNISSEKVFIKFNNTELHKVLLYLCYMEDSMETIINVELDSVGQDLYFRYNDGFNKKTKGNYLKKRLKDGNYCLYINKHNCGTAYFKLINGVFFLKKSNCLIIPPKSES